MRRLAIAGETRQGWPDRFARFFRTLAASLTAKLVLLVACVVALPALLFVQLEDNDQTIRALIARGVEQRDWLIGAALKPALERSNGTPNAALRRELARYGGDGTHLRLLLLRPASAGNADFSYVASTPSTGATQSERGLEDVHHVTSLPQLSQACTRPANAGSASAAPEQALTSVVPVRTHSGCWALVVTHSPAEFLGTTFPRPYGESPEVEFATVGYLALVTLGWFSARGVWRGVRTFGSVARETGSGRIRNARFISRNPIPEFAGTAADLDGMVESLEAAARDIRESIEENAHAVKGAIATIGAAVGALTRALPEPDERQQQVLNLMGASLHRLRALVVAPERIEELTADLKEAPRQRIDLTSLVADVLLRYAELCAGRDVKLARYLEEDLYVQASEDPLIEAMENILDNAVSFAPMRSRIEVRLARKSGTAEITIQDEGPGIDPDKIDYVLKKIRGFWAEFDRSDRI